MRIYLLTQYMSIIGVGLGIVVIIDTIVSPCSAGNSGLYTPPLLNNSQCVLYYYTSVSPVSTSSNKQLTEYINK